MQPDLIAAAARLADVLETENAALAVMNLPAAARLLGEKIAATVAFEAARASGLPRAQQSEMEQLGRRLNELALENRQLLERAMAIQNRVIATIAHAARATAKRAAPGYGRPARPPPCAVLTQA